MALKADFVDADVSASVHATHHNDLAAAVNALYTLASATVITWNGDTNLYRLSAGVLKTDSALTVVGSLTAPKIFLGGLGQIYISGSTVYHRNMADTGNLGIDCQNATVRGSLTTQATENKSVATGTTNIVNYSVPGDAQNRFMADGNGKMLWGDGAGAGDTNLYRATSNALGTDSALWVGGNLSLTVVGKGYRIKEGTNARMGIVTLVAGTVTVSNTTVTAISRIFLTSQSDGGTPGYLRVSARTAGTSFTITSGSVTDTSVVAYHIYEPA